MTASVRPASPLDNKEEQPALIENTDASFQRLEAEKAGVEARKDTAKAKADAKK